MNSVCDVVIDYTLRKHLQKLSLSAYLCTCWQHAACLCICSDTFIYFGCWCGFHIRVTCLLFCMSRFLWLSSIPNALDAQNILF